jgi:Spy/CpxP family protein refolding chaperone
MIARKNLLILFLVLLTIVNVAALATIAYHRFHAKRPFRPMGRPDGRIDFIKEELGLNEEQAEEFQTHMERFRAETEPIHDSIRTMRTELMSELTKQKPDVQRLNQLAEEIGVLEVNLKKQSITHMLEGRSLLTPEQQKKFISLFGEGRDRLRGLKEHGKMDRWPRHPGSKDGE